MIADACGSLGMTGGQSIDLAAEGQDLDGEQIEQMYAMKTGALIHASVMSAAMVAEQLADEKVAAIDAFGRTIGIAFQIKDDILDLTGDTDVIGKQAGADLRLNKATYPGLVGIDKAMLRCDELLASALEKLDDFDETALPLRWLARFIVERGN
jgi:geranylgeranyl pyrophosphate synthase